MVGLSGFEPLTSRLSAVRSSQLSYRPVVSTRTGPALVGFCIALPKSIEEIPNEISSVAP